jgi:hypothetical protein
MADGGAQWEVAVVLSVPALAALAVLSLGGTAALLALRLRRLARDRDAAFAALVRALDLRHELTLHLVRICSGYLVLETPLLEAVALSRYYAMQARTVLAHTKTETDLCWALARLLLAAEDHPELATHPRLRMVVRQVASAEDLAAGARNAYNARAEALGRAIAGPLGRLLARSSDAERAHLFELDPTVARESMMSLLSPRAMPPVPSTPAPTREPRRVVPLASVAFGT